jgi:hypothetical protein
MCMRHELKTSCLKEPQIDSGYWGEFKKKKTLVWLIQIDCFGLAIQISSIG